MIGYLKGRLLSTETDSCLIDVGGVGYEFHASNQTIDDLVSKKTVDTVIWVYTHVREDALILFGFSTKEEKALFLSLLKVNGVGPKMAQSILSGASIESLHEMIEAGNAKGLSALPKVGKKTAEQIILTLQGKLVRVDRPKKTQSKKQFEISSALVHLGFKQQNVDEFIQTLPTDIEVEEGVRRGLGALSGMA